MKYIFYILISCILFIGGCKNFYQITDKAGNDITIYESKLTGKTVNIISETEAFKITTGAQADAMIPSVSLGWFWIAWLECWPGDDLVFYKESHSSFGGITGKTYLHIQNNSDKKISIKSTPKYFIDIGIFKTGFGDNVFQFKQEEIKK